jgi:hypothetical protein
MYEEGCWQLGIMIMTRCQYLKACLKLNNKVADFLERRNSRL